MDEDFKAFMEKARKGLREEYAASVFPEECEISSIQNKMMEMSDGVKLNTYIYIPKLEGPFPTIIQRTCYPHADEFYRVHGEALCKRGYAFVYQYCRGTGGSEGEWSPNINERQDGIDTLTWLSEQNWVDGIGYWGSSYLALTGWVIADRLPEKVQSLYLTHYGTDRYTSAYQSGLFRQDILTAWAMGNAGFPITADYIESCKHRPQYEVDEKLWGKKVNWYRDWITNTRREDPYWQSGFWKMLSEIPADVKVPVYIGEGWYDHHLGSALNTYEALSEESKQYATLHIGAWNHSFQPCLEGHIANNIQNQDTWNSLQWFDETLKKKKRPKGKVRTYVIGSDEWKEWGSFPIAVNCWETLYLSAKEGNCSLEKCTCDEKQEVAYVYDPNHPVITHGAESTFRTAKSIGSLLQPEPNYRSDVISFVSGPLEQDMVIVGKIEVKLFVSTDAEDTAFTAKVMEVFPDGKAYNIRSSISTLAYREDGKQEYTPNEITSIKIAMWDIAWKIHKGSKIRLDISSSDFPQYAVHTNYKGVWSKQEKAKLARQKIYTGTQYPSQIIFPVESVSKK